MRTRHLVVVTGVGLLLAAPCVALFWFRIVQPRVSARQRNALADLPSWTIEAG